MKQEKNGNLMMTQREIPTNGGTDPMVQQRLEDLASCNDVMSAGLLDKSGHLIAHSGTASREAVNLIHEAWTRVQNVQSTIHQVGYSPRRN